MTMNLIRFYPSFIRRFLRFYFKADTIYDLHAPFVADLAKFVLFDKRGYYAFDAIEGLRKQILANDYPIQITDFGAGSKADPRRLRPLKSIARYGAISPRAGRWLFKLAMHYRPQTILEMGTSLGISSLYIRAGYWGAEMISLEGCPETAAQANIHFQKTGSPPIDLRVGPFSATLPGALEDLGVLDFLYLDGDHREGASWNYFQACLEKAGPKSIFVIADIHWSREMENAWKTMHSHPRVRLSVDMFWFGLLFFDPDMVSKQHYALLPWYAKPWRSGIFR